jgi:hypothetical protein
MFSRLGVYESAVITIAGSIVLCSVNDRKKRGESVRVVYVFWVEKYVRKDLLVGRRLRQWSSLVSLSFRWKW